MPLSATYDNPDAADGVEFEVTGLGVLPNRVKTTLTEDQERAFVATNGVTVSDAFKDSEIVKLTGTPTLTGTVEKILGYNPEDVSDRAVMTIDEPYDHSPATSTGQTWADVAPPAEETPVEVATPVPADSTTPAT